MIYFGLKPIIKLFKAGSVSVDGLKGRGKDMLFANVIARRKGYYISNTDYKCSKAKFINLNFSKIDVVNSYTNFLDNKVKKYIYPYPDGTDIYIADCGIYFPAQYCNELNKNYKNVPVFMALSRQLGDCRVHTNTQMLGRVWDKIREQSDTYVKCLGCKVFGKLVIQRVRVYERYEPCLNNVPPLRLNLPRTPEERAQAKITRQTFTNTNGLIKSHILIYFNKSNYDTRLFKEILENGCEEEK